MLHGMGFGALFLLAGSGALVELRGRYVGGGVEIAATANNSWDVQGSATVN
jgi:hypothetical protein